LGYNKITNYVSNVEVSKEFLKIEWARGDKMSEKVNIEAQ